MSTFIDGSRTNRAGYSIILKPGNSELDIYLGDIFPGDLPATGFSFMLIMQQVGVDQPQRLAVYVCSHHLSESTRLRCYAVNNPNWNFSRTTFAQNHVLLEGIPQDNTFWYAYCIPLNFE